MKKLLTLILIISAFAVQAATFQITQSNIKTVKIVSGSTYILAEHLTGSLSIAGVHDVNIQAATGQSHLYGGIGLTGLCYNILIQNIDISGSNICIQVRSGGTNLKIDGCTLHDATYGIWLRSNQTTDFNNGVVVDRCRIYNCQNDGYYGYKMHRPVLTNSVIYRCNMLWKAPETDQKIASGDGVQWIIVDNPLIEGNIFDRSVTGNKFCFIISGTTDVQPNVFVINNNTFRLPIKTGQGGAGLYIYDLKSNTNVEFAFNQVIGDMAGVKFNSLGTFYSNGNKYTGSPGAMPIAIELQRATAKGISISDNFVNVARKGSSNVKFE